MHKGLDQILIRLEIYVLNLIRYDNKNSSATTVKKPQKIQYFRNF